MKRLKYILIAVVSSCFVFLSCSEDAMDEINQNKNNPENMSSKYLMTDIQVETSFATTGSDLAFYSSIYTELLGGADAQMYEAQTRNGAPSLASTYNNKWNSTYMAQRSLKLVIEKCSDGGVENGNYQTLGIAQILYAYNWALLTDLFGDIPMSEALNPGKILQPKLDKQEDIYKEVFKLLDNAITNLEKPNGLYSIGNSDLIFGGDNQKWIKAAYGLKARYTMRLSYRNPDYQSVIDNVNKSFTNNIDFRMEKSGIPYPFYRFEKDRTGLVSSKTYYDLMKSNDTLDPRLKDYFVPLTAGGETKLVLLDHSVAKPNQGKGVYSASGLSKSEANISNSIYLLSYHELLFLKAEAEARLGKETEAIETLELAVKAGLNKAQSFKYPDYVPVIDTDLTGSALIKKIATEKYISFFEVESIEAYNDIRRWKAMGEENIQLQNTGNFPKRFSYGLSDLVSNKNISTVFGDGSYVYSDNVWWAGGTR